jgi:hypothetical protein
MRRSGGAARAEENDIPEVLSWRTHPPDPFRVNGYHPHAYFDAALLPVAERLAGAK